MKVSASRLAACGFSLLLLVTGVECGGGKYHWYTMFMFGDSFVDTGNLPKTGGRSPLSRQWHWPYGTFNGGRSGNPIGRFSNYLVQSDVIGSVRSGIKHYCDPSGMTFAVGGAGVYDVPDRLPTLAQQICNFKRLIKDGTISKWHLADSVALVAISGNDYAHATNSSDMIGFIRNVTTEIAANVKRLQKLGVKKVLVNDLHPVGCTPWLSRTTNYTVCDARGNMAATFHNTYLRKSLANTRNVHILDLNTAFTKILSGKGSKLQHKLTPCCESFDPEGYCGQRGNKSERLYTVCTNPDQYFYWDSVHPTQAGWEAVMKQLQKPMLHFLTHN
uniref:Uncharacterized protein n=1 Tax=Avena sativa TaxID=4498 RepID=A0ACD5UPF2_AVESA